MTLNYIFCLGLPGKLFTEKSKILPIVGALRAPTIRWIFHKSVNNVPASPRHKIKQNI